METDWIWIDILKKKDSFSTCEKIVEHVIEEIPASFHLHEINN